MDNGPSFNSREFRLFAKYLGFTHHPVTSHRPQANGEPSRLPRSNMAAGNKPYSSFCKTTKLPHVTTGESPAKLMFGRPVWTRLPERPPIRKQDAGTRKHDEKQKQKIKEAADRGKHNIPQLARGNKVIIHQERRNKLTPLYEPRPLKAITVKGSMVTTTRSTGEKITRNRSHFNLIPDTSKTTMPITQMQGESDDEWPGEDRNEFPLVDNPPPPAQQEAPPERWR